MDYYSDAFNCLILPSAASLCFTPCVDFSIGMASDGATSSTNECKQQHQQPTFTAETIAAFNGVSAKIGIAVERSEPMTPWILYLGHRFEVVAVVSTSGGARPSDLPPSLLAVLEVVLPQCKADNKYEEPVLSKSQITMQMVQPQDEADRLARLACIENIEWEISRVYSGSESMLTIAPEEEERCCCGTTMVLRASLSLEDKNTPKGSESGNVAALSSNTMSMDPCDMSDMLQMLYFKSKSSDSHQRSEWKVPKYISAACEVQVMEPLEVGRSEK